MQQSVYLEHIVEETKFLQNHVAPVALHEFTEHPVLSRAAIYSVQIISEATRNLPAEWTDAHPEIPWRQIRGIGNITRHGYASLRLKIIWEIAKLHAPSLAAVARRLLAEHGDI